MDEPHGALGELLGSVITHRSVELDIRSMFRHTSAACKNRADERKQRDRTESMALDRRNGRDCFGLLGANTCSQSAAPRCCRHMIASDSIFIPCVTI